MKDGMARRNYRGFTLLLGAAGLVAAASCSKSLWTLDGGPGGGHWEPTPTPSLIGTPPAPSISISSPQVLNQCFVLTSSTTGTTVLLEATAGAISIGEQLLLLQVTDDTGAMASGDGSQITAPSQIGDAGVWQIATVASLSAAGGGIETIGLQTAVAISYSSPSPSRRAQACSIPAFDQVDLLVTGEVAAQAWDGKTGGVVAFAANHLSLEGSIRADADGFRGGPATAGGTICGGGSDDYANASSGGRKGESLDGRAFAGFGRGNYRAGGGGGDTASAGGGGGGNAGAGGRGGDEAASCGGTTGFGKAGASIAFPQRLFFGGGGGAGHNTTAGAGGNGGGLVVVLAGSITGSGTISAEGGNGTSALASAAGGSGGGGAGGMVMVNVATPSALAGGILVRGGAGADNFTQRGTGGGGGGGRMDITGAFTQATALVDGGASGMDAGSARGAANGGGGTVTLHLATRFSVTS
jgi:hypothetical protein